MRWILVMLVACGGTEPNDSDAAVDELDVELTSFSCCGEVGGTLWCGGTNADETIGLEMHGNNVQIGENTLTDVSLEEGPYVGAVCSDDFSDEVDRVLELVQGSVRAVLVDDGQEVRVELEADAIVLETSDATATVTFSATDLSLAGLP